MRDVDFGRTAVDYAAHRVGFPDSLFVRLRDYGIGLPGQRIVDLGTGTGTLARGFALAGCQVTGIDPAASMLERARDLDDRAGVRVEYLVARAENTGLGSAAFDVAAAGQCWHWFDVPRASMEIRRILRPGGLLVVPYYDWLPLPRNVVLATERLILDHNPEWRGADGDGMHGEVVGPVQEAKFTGIETFSYDEPAAYSHEAWRGRIRASAGVAASLPPERVAAFDTELAALLSRDFPAEPLLTEHRVWCLVARSPDG